MSSSIKGGDATLRPSERWGFPGTRQGMTRPVTGAAGSKQAGGLLGGDSGQNGGGVPLQLAPPPSLLYPTLGSSQEWGSGGRPSGEAASPGFTTSGVTAAGSFCCPLFPSPVVTTTLRATSYYPRFTGVETEAQTGWVTCLRSHSEGASGPASEPECLGLPNLAGSSFRPFLFLIYSLACVCVCL